MDSPNEEFFPSIYFSEKKREIKVYFTVAA